MLHIAAALIVFTFLCYRGFRIAEREIDPVYAAKTLRLGVAAVLLALFLQLIGGYAGVAPYAYGDLLLFATGFVFLFLSLLARSLANLSHVRQGHSIERRSDIRSQECAEMQMIVVLSLLFLLVALASASFASPGFLAHMQQFVAAGYVWATHIFATVIAAVLTPLFWLLSAIHFASPGTTHASTAASHLRSVGDYGNVHPSHQTSRPYPTNSHAGSASFTWISAVESAQPIVLIVLTATIFVWFVQRVLRRLRGASQPHEQRESIWSWSLFWRRLLAFWRILFGRLRSLREAGGWGERGGGTLDPASQLQEPPVRDIRALYHTLLRAAARRGYPRHRGETPFEFEQRLEQHVPAIKTQLATITAIYVAARYGGYVPGEAEIDHARDIWAQLEQSWRANSQA